MSGVRMEWIAALGVGLCAVGVWWLLAQLVQTHARTLSQAWLQHHRSLDDALRRSRRRVRATQVLAAQCVAVVCVSVWAALAGSVVPLLLIVPVAWAPGLWLQHVAQRRAQQIEAQLDAWLLGLAHALKVVPSLGEALRSCVPLIGDPLAQELQTALDAHALGVPLQQCLRDMTTRVPSSVLAAAVATLEIARRTGGDLPTTLERAAESLREMARLHGVVRVKTAESRAQVWVIAAVPAVLLAVFRKTSPELLDVLLQSTRGHVVLALACVLWLGAIASALRILQVDI